MFEVTEAARELIAEVLDELATEEGLAVRMFLAKGGWDMKADSIRPGDTTFAHDGKVVLAVDKETCEQFSGKTLDVEHKPAGPSLTLVDAPKESRVWNETPPGWALTLLTTLVQQGALELLNGTPLGSLAGELAEKIPTDGNSAFMARAISRWLLDHEAVAELFIDDESLAEVFVHLGQHSTGGVN